MGGPARGWRRRVATLLAEPTVHFFMLGALLFLAHRLVVGDARVIVVSPGVKADLERRFRDRSGGRPPTPAQLDSELGAWKRDEALYREALRDRLDRDDAAIRSVLADHVRARARRALPTREPSPAELDRWLATHGSLYETPRRYDYQYVVFRKAARANSVEPLEKYQQSLKDGADPRTLGRPIVGGNLTDQDLRERFGPGLAARIEGLPVGQWQRLESDEGLLLARLNAVGGGLPSVDSLHQQLVVDWSFAEQQRGVDEAVQAIVDRYRFKEPP